jgi:hypothetical protein
LDAVEVKGTPAQYSVALRRRPVNHFQIEPAVNFRNYNGRGFRVSWSQNRVREIAISARLNADIRRIQCRRDTCETQPVKNSFDTNPREIDLRAALRLNGQVNHGVDML